MTAPVAEHRFSPGGNLAERSPLNDTRMVCILLRFMPGPHGATHKRVNISLPAETLRLIERVGGGENRSRFIDAAVRHFVRSVGRARLRKRLEEATIRDAAEGLEIAEEWFAVDEEAWGSRKR